MSEAAQRQAGTAAHGQPTTCVRDVRRLFGLIREGGGWRHAGKPAIAEVEVDGDRAEATVVVGSWSSAIPLVREGGSWKLHSFFGTAPEVSRTAAARFAARQAHPGDEDADVLASDETIGEPSPCLDVYTASFPEIAGGCLLSVNSDRIELKLLTVFGVFDFARCSMSYGVRVDRRGRTWTDGLVFENVEDGGATGSACGDVDECDDKAGRALPWKGSIRPVGDDVFEHRSHICLDTCIGHFEGMVATDLVRSGDRTWGVEAERARVGSSGFELDGRLRVDADRFELQVAES